MFLVCSKGIFFSKKDLQLHSSFNIYPYNELKWQKDFTQRYIITREGPFTGLAALELRRSKFTGPQVLARSRAAHAIWFGGPALLLITHTWELKGLSTFYQ